MVVIARATTDAATLAPDIRAALRSLDRDQPPSKITTLDELLSDQLAKPRFYTALLGSFAAVGLLLAAVGIYGVMSFAVARRTHEFGIRMALGAERADILGLALGTGMRVTAIGAGLGLAGALAATRLVGSLLYGVKPGDPLTLACVTLLLIGVALGACYLAARRATAVDPNAALRCD